MKLIGVIFLFFSFSLFAKDLSIEITESSVVDLNGFKESMRLLLSPKKLEPDSEIDFTCGKYEHYGNGLSCSNKLAHCKGLGNSFCFDGYRIPNDGYGANMNMMYYLCSDIEFPPVSGIDFGRCDLDTNSDISEREIRVEGKIHCVCQEHTKGGRVEKKWSCSSKEQVN